MRLTLPLDKILNNEVKIRALRILCQNSNGLSGRQIAKMVGASPKTAHTILQDLLREGVVTLRIVGKSYLFHLNETRAVVHEVLKPLFLFEKKLSERLFDIIRKAIKKSALKNDILSVALFGSVHAKTKRATSDIDLFVVIKTAALKMKTSDLFSDIDRQTSSQWGNLISPYVNTLTEFKNNAKRKTGIVPNALKSYQLIYGDRLEKLLR